MKLLALLLSATACSLSVNGKGYYGYGYGQSPEEVIPFVPSPEIVPSPEVAPAPVCVPLVCVGDKSLCPIPEYMEGVHPCCDDEACATCHYNGCNQCCVGAFKPSYAEPCQSCCEYDANCMMCSDFIGCQQCSEGYTLTKGDDGLYYCA